MIFQLPRTIPRELLLLLMYLLLLVAIDLSFPLRFTQAVQRELINVLLSNSLYKGCLGQDIQMG